jgi:ribosomal protein S18 acetylase RimI-like enzyme
VARCAWTVGGADAIGVPRQDGRPLCTLALVCPAVDISAGSVSDIPQVRDAFLSLHEHHRRISAVVLTEPDERAWSERVSTYERYFAAGCALLHLARIDGGCVGYAFTVLHPGSDDTFPLGAGYAELYTIAVVPASRGLGIGSALLDAVDAALRDQAIPNLTVAVMCANEAAIRLYRRRGLIPGELILYRIGGGAT